MLKELHLQQIEQSVSKCSGCLMYQICIKLISTINIECEEKK